jgi:hypothetical protein
MLPAYHDIFIDLRRRAYQSACTLLSSAPFAAEVDFPEYFGSSFGRVVESFLQRGSPTPTSLAFCCPAFLVKFAR